MSTKSKLSIDPHTQRLLRLVKEGGRPKPNKNGKRNASSQEQHHNNYAQHAAKLLGKLASTYEYTTANPSRLWDLLGRIHSYLNSPLWYQRENAALAISEIAKSIPLSDQQSFFWEMHDNDDTNDACDDDDGIVSCSRNNTETTKSNNEDRIGAKKHHLKQDFLWLTLSDLLSSHGDSRKGEGNDKINRIGLDVILERGRLLLSRDEYDNDESDESVLHSFDTNSPDYLQQRIETQRQIMARKLGFCGGISGSSAAFISNEMESILNLTEKDVTIKNTTSSTCSVRTRVMERKEKKRQQSSVSVQQQKRKKITHGKNASDIAHTKNLSNDTSDDDDNNDDGIKKQYQIRTLLLLEMKRTSESTNNTARHQSYTTNNHKRPQTLLATELIYRMFDPDWFIRHGAFLGTLSLLKAWNIQQCFSSSSSSSCGGSKSNHEKMGRWPEDILVRSLSVLVLDRFGDFSSCGGGGDGSNNNGSSRFSAMNVEATAASFHGGMVVAPVREIAAQLLGLVVSHSPKHVQKDTFWLLKRMSSRIMSSKGTGIARNFVRQQDTVTTSDCNAVDSWEVRHGALLGIKYLTAALVASSKNAAAADINTHTTTTSAAAENIISWNDIVFVAINGLSDESDDVKGVASQIILCLLHQLPKPILLARKGSYINSSTTLLSLEEDIILCCTSPLLMALHSIQPVSSCAVELLRLLGAIMGSGSGKVSLPETKPLSQPKDKMNTNNTNDNDSGYYCNFVMKALIDTHDDNGSKGGATTTASILSLIQAISKFLDYDSISIQISCHAALIRIVRSLFDNSTNYGNFYGSSNSDDRNKRSYSPLSNIASSINITTMLPQFASLVLQITRSLFDDETVVDMTNEEGQLLQLQKELQDSTKINDNNIKASSSNESNNSKSYRVELEKRRSEREMLRSSRKQCLSVLVDYFLGYCYQHHISAGNNASTLIMLVVDALSDTIISLILIFLELQKVTNTITASTTTTTRLKRTGNSMERTRMEVALFPSKQLAADVIVQLYHWYHKLVSRLRTSVDQQQLLCHTKKQPQQKCDACQGTEEGDTLLDFRGNNSLFCLVKVLLESPWFAYCESGCMLYSALTRHHYTSNRATNASIESATKYNKHVNKSYNTASQQNYNRDYITSNNNYDCPRNSDAPCIDDFGCEARLLQMLHNDTTTTPPCIVIESDPIVAKLLTSDSNNGAAEELWSTCDSSLLHLLLKLFPSSSLSPNIASSPITRLDNKSTNTQSKSYKTRSRTRATIALTKGTKPALSGLISASATYAKIAQIQAITSVLDEWENAFKLKGISSQRIWRRTATKDASANSKRIINDNFRNKPVSTIHSMRLAASIANAILSKELIASLPSKLTPLVRSLMTSLKNESSLDRQSRTHGDLVILVKLLLNAQDKPSKQKQLQEKQLINTGVATASEITSSNQQQHQYKNVCDKIVENILTMACDKKANNTSSMHVKIEKARDDHDKPPPQSSHLSKKCGYPNRFTTTMTNHAESVIFALIIELRETSFLMNLAPVQRCLSPLSRSDPAKFGRVALNKALHLLIIVSGKPRTKATTTRAGVTPTTIGNGLPPPTTSSSYMIQSFLPSTTLLACSSPCSSMRRIAVLCTTNLLCNCCLDTSSSINTRKSMSLAENAGNYLFPILFENLHDTGNEANRLGAIQVLESIVLGLGILICPLVRSLLPAAMSLMNDPVVECASVSARVFAALVRVAPLW